MNPEKPTHFVKNWYSITAIQNEDYIPRYSSQNSPPIKRKDKSAHQRGFGGKNKRIKNFL